MKKSSFLTLLVAIALTACGPKYIINESRDLPNGEWAYNDTLRFTFAIAGPLKLYDLFVEIEHAADYPWQNLYTRIYTEFPDGQRLHKPLSLELSDQLGQWQGRCRSDRCTVRIPIQQGAYFNQAGAYAITLEQYMRVNPVPGVQRVALQIVELASTLEN